MFAITNKSTDALKSKAFSLAEGKNPHAVFEYNLAVRSGRNDGTFYNMTQREVNSLFSRRHGGHCGATKRTHTEHPDGWEMTLFVVKRYKYYGHEFWGEGCGNQLIDEINCWEKLAMTDDADFLCPIIKYFTAKSDKCKPLSDKMKERVVIIAQKAERISDLASACREAEYLNRLNGCRGTSAKIRQAQLEDLAERMSWRDVRYNRGNSGVIFDYAQNCYKAVFVDYAL